MSLHFEGNRRYEVGKMGRITNDGHGQPFADSASLHCYTKPDPTSEKVAVHAVAIFNSGDFGEEASSPVTFRLSIINAELVIIIPEFDKDLIEVDRESVMMPPPAPTAKREIVSQKEGVISATLSHLGINLGTKGKVSRKETTSYEAALESMEITCSLSGDGNYRWHIVGNDNTLLKGMSWDVSKPRLSVKKRKKLKLPATVRVEIRCKRKDVHIDNVLVKSTAKALYPDIEPQKIIAAQAYVRTKLLELGFLSEEGNMETSKFTLGMEVLEIE